MLDWALVRSGQTAALKEKFPKLDEWRSGQKRPTLKQLEGFAAAARVPVGYLLLPAPPDEPLPVKDLRTPGSQGVRRPSPDLLDTIYLCQRRQAWYQDYAQTAGEPERAYVGSATTADDPRAVAAAIAETIGFDLQARAEARTWEDALRLLAVQAESAGVLVMVSGVVGSNTHRKLQPEEFRGFALADRLAPVVFVNGADTKAGQMFTLAHELAHVWLGESAVTDASAGTLSDQATERWCNAAAAELLVPLKAFREAVIRDDALRQVPGLARRFKVSTLVILRRLLDAGMLSPRAFREVYGAEVARLQAMMAGRSSGGDYYLTQPARLSRRFARAVISSTYEGQTLFTDAFAMLGVRREQTLRELGRSLEVLS